MSQPQRARPVTDLPIAALTERAEDLARGWAIALVLSRPLEGLGGIPLEELAREAPRLCVQLLAALESEAELERLTSDDRPSGRGEAQGPRRLRAICGADDGASLVEAVEALRGVVWEALLERLGSHWVQSPPPRLLADAGDRLAHVCARLLAASIGGRDRDLTPRPTDAAVAVSAAAAAPRAAGARPRDEQPATTEVRGRIEGLGGRLAIIDEALPEVERRGASAEHRAREIEIRDARSEGGDLQGEAPRTPWTAAIARELEHFMRDGRPFAVLLVELRGVDALAAEGASERAARLAQDAERVLAAEARQAARARPAPADPRAIARLGSLTRESAGRLWLLAPDTDRAEGSELARRLERAVGRPAGHGGGAVEALIGAAVCPNDGTEAGALAAHADMDLHATRAGQPVSGAGGERPPRATS